MICCLVGGVRVLILFVCVCLVFTFRCLDLLTCFGFIVVIFILVLRLFCLLAVDYTLVVCLFMMFGLVGFVGY